MTKLFFSLATAGLFATVAVFAQAQGPVFIGGQKLNGPVFMLPTINIEARAGAPRPEAYPQRAFERGRSGRVAVRCETNAEGALAACRVTDEKPNAMGFRDAALAQVAQLRIEPGPALQGATVIQMINYIFHK